MKNGSNGNIRLAVSKIPEGVTFTSKLLLSLLKLKLFFIILLLFPFNNILRSQSNDFSVSIKGNFTSSSRYYPSSMQSSSIVYSYESYQTIDDLFGYGLEVRYNYSEHIRIGLSAERVSGSTSYLYRSSQIQMKSNFTMYIFEANGYYTIPLSGERFKFYIGGGLNMAKCDNSDELASIKSVTLSSPVNFGIQALSGFEFFINKDLSARFELKFRDPIVENENKFNSSRTFYNQRFYNVPTNSYTTKINIDGLVFDLSFAYHLF
jgi:opacity protein-like surface antigen